MDKSNSNTNKEGLTSLAIDPDVLAKELAAELQGDPLDEIDLAGFNTDQINSSECDSGLQWLQQGYEERLQGLRVFCEHRDTRSIPFLIPLLSKPCPVERMSAVYALGRNPSPLAVKTLLELLQSDANAFVRKAAAWSLGNYPKEPVLEPLLNSLLHDVAAVRLWAASSLAEVGSISSKNASNVARHLLVSLQIDQEPLVRSNCIWSLGRLYENLFDDSKNDLINVFFNVLLNDLEPSVRDEARTVLEQLENPKIRHKMKILAAEGLIS